MSPARVLEETAELGPGATEFAPEGCGRWNMHLKHQFSKNME